jgi:hypothetical protein
MLVNIDVAVCVFYLNCWSGNIVGVMDWVLVLFGGLLKLERIFVN